MLTSEMLYRLVEDKCNQHGVCFDYCYQKMVKINPKTGFELVDAMDELLAWAYFNDYSALYKGIIPYREYTSVEEAIANLEAQELLN